ncbi:hypothetical protein ACLB2K_060603 [Fragaria x ananassa]
MFACSGKVSHRSNMSPSQCSYLLHNACISLLFIPAFCIDRIMVMKWVTKEEDETDEKERGTNIQHVILDMSNVMNVDTSGILALEEIHKKLLSHGIELAVANPRWQVIHRDSSKHEI